MIKRKNSVILGDVESPTMSELEDSFNSNGKRAKNDQSASYSNSKRSKTFGSEEDDCLLSDDDYLSTDDELNKFSIKQFGDSFLSSQEDEVDSANNAVKHKRPNTRSNSANANNFNAKFKNNFNKIKNLNELEDVDDELDNQIPLI